MLYLSVFLPRCLANKKDAFVNIRIMILGLILSLPALQGCSESKETEKAAPEYVLDMSKYADAKKESFLIGESNEDIQKSLVYSCNPMSTSTPTIKEKNVDLALWKSCLQKLPAEFNIQENLSWNCAQSDRSSIKRPLPDAAQIKLTANFKKVNGKLISSVAAKDWQSFLQPAINGNTTYFYCREDARANFLAKIEDSLQKKFESSCGTRAPEDDIDFLYGIESGLSNVEKPIFANEFAKKLLLPVLPYYQDLKENAESKTNPFSGLGICSPMSDRGAPHDRSLNDSAIKILSANFIETELSSIIDNASISCVHRILDFYLPDHTANSIYQKCLVTPEKDQCPVYVARLRSFYQKLDAITKDKLSTFSFLSALDSKNQYPSLLVRKSLEKSRTNCELLPIGKQKSVFNKWLNTQENKEFTLKRIDENTSELTVNVAFKPSCDSSSYENKKVAKAWLERANSCLERMSPYLKGPDGGLLKIKLQSESTDKAPQFNVIRVLNEAREVRQDATLYSPSSNCMTTLHEVLHLTGLVDEYPETEKEFVNQITMEKQDINVQCRILGPEDSIMRNLKGPIFAAANHNTSLLKPAHYRMLVYPNCAEKNKIYQSCSRFAYTGNFNGQCTYPKDLPAECSNDSFDWINN